MKTTTFLTKAAMAGALVVLAHNAQAGGLIGTGNLYQNDTTSEFANFNYDNGSAGNEVKLAGSDSSDTITGFSFQYDLQGTGTPTGNYELSFYGDTGPLVDGYPSPGATPLWTSGVQDLGAGGFTGPDGQTINFYSADLGGGVTVPEDFTWIVTFSGLTTNEEAGLALYDPATVGGNYGDAWVDPPGGWNLDADIGGDPAVFGAVIDGTVPDASCLPISALAVGAALAMVKRFQKQA